MLYGEAMTGYTYGVIINSSQIVILLDCKHVLAMGLFLHFLKLAMTNNENIRANRFDSFARVKSRGNAEWLVDGEEYFDAVC